MRCTFHINTECHHTILVYRVQCLLKPNHGLCSGKYQLTAEMRNLSHKVFSGIYNRHTILIKDDNFHRIWLKSYFIANAGRPHQTDGECLQWFQYIVISYLYNCTILLFTTWEPHWILWFGIISPRNYKQRQNTDYPPLTPHGLLKLTCSPRTSCDDEVKGEHNRTFNIGGEELHTHSSHSLILCDSYCRARKTYHSLCDKILDV